MSVPQYVELVTVIAASNAGLIAFAKSILNEAGIDYVTMGEELSQLCWIEVKVAKEDVDTAKELLKELL